MTHTRTAKYLKQHKLLHIKSGLCYTLGNCKRPPLDPLLPGDLLALLAIVGLVRVFGLEGTLRCEWGLEDLLAEERLDTRLAAGEEVWTVILSLRTNIPCLSLHLKYFTPLTVPLFLPANHACKEVNTSMEYSMNDILNDHRVLFTTFPSHSGNLHQATCCKVDFWYCYCVLQYSMSSTP